MNYTIFNYPFEHKVRFDKDEGMNRKDTIEFLKENCNKIYCLFVEQNSDNVAYFDMGVESDTLAYNVSSTIREIVIPNIGSIIDNGQLIHIIINSHDESPDVFDHIIIEKLDHKDKYLLHRYNAVKDRLPDNYERTNYIYNNDDDKKQSSESSRDEPPDCIIC